MSDFKHDVVAERWAVLIKVRMESGMTVREWCHDRDIKESRYYYWLRILRRRAVENTGQPPRVSPFVELPADICQEQFPASAAAVIRKGNITIEVTGSASAGFIKKLWRHWQMPGNVKRYSRIYLAYGCTDLRFGIDGLARGVQDHFSLDPFQKGCLFLFCGRRTDRIKGLLWEGDGFVLVYKRLESGCFQWPRTAQKAREITPKQFTWLMQGLAVEQKKGSVRSHRKGRADKYDDRFCAKHRNFLPVFSGAFSSLSE